jgi:microcystin-dependent protein
MADAYIGEVRLFCGDFTPEGWLPCDGGTYNIGGFTYLFAVIGTTYGGDGKTSFCVPNFSGRAAIGVGQGQGLTRRAANDMIGTIQETLTSAQIPPHTHNVRGMSKASPAVISANPQGNVWAKSSVDIYTPNAPNTQLDSHAVSSFAGSNNAHNNVQPALCLNFIICYDGYFPAWDQQGLSPKKEVQQNV